MQCMGIWEPEHSITLSGTAKPCGPPEPAEGLTVFWRLGATTVKGSPNAMSRI